MKIYENKDHIIIKLEKVILNERIDKFLNKNIKYLTRNLIQNLCNVNKIYILKQNNQVKYVDKNYKIKDYDEIYIKNDIKLSNCIEAQNIPLKIVYEDDYIIIIDKIKGMLVHPSNGYLNNTLVNALHYFYPNNLSSIDSKRPGIVHRLDKDTSGLLIVAKNNLIHNLLIKYIQHNKIIKKYEAIICGNLLNNEGIIDKAVLRGSINRKKMIINSYGKKSITFYKSIKKYNKFEHVKFQLQTGRTHQIRLHMASIIKPILGDSIYGNLAINNQFPNLIGQCLHANEITFNHPITNKLLHIKTLLPKYFIDVLNKISNY